MARYHRRFSQGVNVTVFDFATVAVSFILGLAVTYLLESIVQAFRARRTCRLDWLPFVWAAGVLVHQFQFWWALYELNTMPSMSVSIFSLLLVLAGVLFLAGALVLPSGETEYPNDLGEYFTTDGSWGAGAVALYNFVAVLANVVLFDVRVTNPVNLLNLCLVVIAVLVVATRARTWQVALTIAYVVVLVYVEIIATPAVYDSSVGSL
jgi:hypothetical protein